MAALAEKAASAAASLYYLAYCNIIFVLRKASHTAYFYIINVYSQNNKIFRFF